MIDTSPPDEPPIEAAISAPAGVGPDVDGSASGCGRCGGRFGRTQARDAVIVAGEVEFVHTPGACRG